MVDKAIETLVWANRLNPGPWKAHSMGVGRAAREIASAAGLDRQKAYFLGLLHDIGRYEGPRELHHVIAGYELMMEKGWEDAAHICITHSFPDGKLEHFFGKWDVTDAELQKIRSVLSERPLDDYDRLISLCDALTWGENVCLMEKRMVDVVLRHGAPAGMDEKWRAWFAIKTDFENRIGDSIYSLFPESVETTFAR